MQLNIEFSNNKEYKVNGIQDSTIYAKESTEQLPGLYYLDSWKSYSEEENTWELALAIQYLQRLVTAYQKNNLKKPIMISVPVNTTLPMARLTIKPTIALTKKQDIWLVGRSKYGFLVLVNPIAVRSWP